MVTAVVEAESAWAAAVGEAIRLELGARPQRWLAERTDMDPSTISRFVLGKQLPTLDQIDAMAQALGTSRRFLLGRAGYVEDVGEIDLSAVPQEVRIALLGAYDAAVADMLHRREGPVGDDGSGSDLA